MTKTTEQGQISPEEKKQDALAQEKPKSSHPKCHTKTLTSSTDFKQELDELRETVKESYDTGWYKRMISAPVDDQKLPVIMKIFGILCILGSLYALGNVVWDVVYTVLDFQSGKMATLGVSTTVVTFVFLADLIIMTLVFLVFGISILRNRRRYAALVIYVIYGVLLLGAICSIMLNGASVYLVAYGIPAAIMVAFQVYLDPSLREERMLQRRLRDFEIRTEQEEGTLGRDETGKGYIDLNFFNLFWIFVVVSILGDGIETLYHYFVVVPGEWQDRAGLLFGPFSPIYGCGAVLMTLFLNRLYKRNILIIFFLSAIIGGLFEALVSLFMQYTFGAVAWDYTGQWLALFGGRTCGVAMVAWGFLGVVWLKILLPILLHLVNLIPWNWRYGVTLVATILMMIDCVMSLQALDCWYERLSGDQIVSPIQQFYADHFDNSYMENRFQSMTINPDSAVRQGKV